MHLSPEGRHFKAHCSKFVQQNRVDFARFGESFNYYIFSVLCSVYLYSVQNIPIFKDRSNRSCDTAQTMRGHACVYQNINPVINNFSKWCTDADGASLFRFPFDISLQYSPRFHIISKKVFDLRE